MGLMDKFKNLFTDEEIIEEENIEPVEIKEVKKEEINKLPTFMREKLEEEKEEKIKINNFNFEEEKEQSKEEKKDNKINIHNNLEIKEEKKNFKFPIEFSNNDFIETRTRSKQKEYEKIEEERIIKPKDVEEPKKKKAEVKVAELYKGKKEQPKEEKKKFKATPIISPIYGVLDKNYSPVDVECNVGENFEKRRPSKNVDFDSVRKKAYGNLSKEIKENLMCENCEYLKEAKECKKTKNDIEENIVYEAMNNSKEEYVYDKQNYSKTNLEKDDYYRNECYKYQDITLDEATENYYDYGVEYEKAPDYNNKTKENNDDYIRLDETEEVVFNNTEERPVKSIPPVKSSINLLSTLKKSMGDEQSEKKNLELTDDLFNLIDSMYDERND